MRTFQCHKRVKAAQIFSITDRGADGLTLHFTPDEHTEPDGKLYIDIPLEMVSRYRPVPGDYLVEYIPDGYRSISPKKAFEDGYGELPSEDALAQAVAFTVQPHVGASAEVKPTMEHGAIIGVQVVKNGCTYQELTSEPLTDEVSCLMFGCKAGMAISDRVKVSV